VKSFDSICLATIGVCIFCALAPVSALFDLQDKIKIIKTLDKKVHNSFDFSRIDVLFYILIDKSKLMCYNNYAKQIEQDRKVFFFKENTILFILKSYVYAVFDKNANSTCAYDIKEAIPYSGSICLATIGVCVFCALAPVSALFDLQEKQTKKN